MLESAQLAVRFMGYTDHVIHKEVVKTKHINGAKAIRS